MRLTLVSNHRNLEVRHHARFSYRCSGGKSPSCTGQILKNELYVARIEWTPQRGRAIPLSIKTDVGKYCAHCALAHFTDIRISEVTHHDSSDQIPQMPLVPEGTPTGRSAVFRHLP